MITHILTAAQFTRAELDELFSRTNHLRRLPRQRYPQSLRRMVVALLFYEPSTRTRMSFELAAQYLGAKTIVTEAAGMFSSAAKGETLEDTVRVLASYGVDAIVIRHKDAGAATRAAAASPVCIVNAGDGGDEHPTQALLDLYTIVHSVRHGGVTRVTLCGDLEHSRTVRSLCRLMIGYADGNGDVFRLILCSPPNIRLGEDVRHELERARIPFEETPNFSQSLASCDVFYQTRVQIERFGTNPDGSPTSEAIEAHHAVQSRFQLNAETLRFLRPDAIVMHPLPRVGEITPEVDADPRAKYFPEQTRNGLLIRMALLEQLLASDG